MMSRLWSLIGVFSVFACGVLLCGCGGGGNSSGSSTSNPAIPTLPLGFTAGGSKTVTVPSAANSTVADTSTGLTFAFPSGGDGSLTTAALTQTPTLPLDGSTPFYLQYTGSNPVTLSVPDRTGYDTYFFYYGPSTGALEGGAPRAQRWNAVAPTVANGVVTFTLPLSATRNRASGGAIEGATIQLARGTADTDIRAKAAADISGVLTALPSSLQSTVGTRQAANPPEYVFVSPSGGCCYEGYSWGPLSGSTPHPVLTYRTDADDDTVAHEVGHYMTHMIAGDAAYYAIQQTSPDENHGLATVQGNRTTISEDYAYYMQFVLRGSVGAANPTNVRMILGGSPTTVDYPSYEGYATVLMAYLTNTSGSAINFAGSQQPIPAVGLAPGAVLQAYAAGATSINGLVGSLTNLVPANMAGALPVVAECTGWSFHGSGCVLSQQTSQPVAGVTVTPVVTVNGVDYTLPSAISGADGTFTLPRLFPGAFSLKFNDPATGKTTTLAVNNAIAWMDSTTKSESLGDYDIDHPNTNNQYAICNYVNAEVQGLANLHDSAPYGLDSAQGIDLLASGPATWTSPTTFTFHETADAQGYGQTFSGTGTLNSDYTELISLSVSETSPIANWSFTMTNVPIVPSSGAFGLAGWASGVNVPTYANIGSYTMGTISMTSMNWASSSYGAALNFAIFQH